MSYCPSPSCVLYTFPILLNSLRKRPNNFQPGYPAVLYALQGSYQLPLLQLFIIFLSNQFHGYTNLPLSGYRHANKYITLKLQL